MPISSARRTPAERAVISRKRATSGSAMGTRRSAAYASISARRPTFAGCRRSRYSACSPRRIASARAFIIELGLLSSLISSSRVLREPAHDCEPLAARDRRHLVEYFGSESDQQPGPAAHGYADALAARVAQQAVKRERAARVLSPPAAGVLVAQEDDDGNQPLLHE